MKSASAYKYGPLSLALGITSSHREKKNHTNTYAPKSQEGESSERKRKGRERKGKNIITITNMGGWAIAVHGGAGVDPNLPLERQEQAKQLLTRCLNLGISALGSNLTAIDVVELVVRPLFPFTPCYHYSVPLAPTRKI